MKGETVSKADLPAILVQQYGIIFFPKREVAIPQVTIETIRGKVRPNRENTTLQKMQELYEFLSTPAIGDTLGSNHGSRIEQYGKIEEDFGKSARTFLHQYAEDNQLRLNILSAVLLTLDNLSERVIEPSIRQYLNESRDQLYGLLIKTREHPSYDGIDNVAIKMGIVHTFEDTIIGVLGVFAKS